MICNGHSIRKSDSTNAFDSFAYSKFGARSKFPVGCPAENDRREPAKSKPIMQNDRCGNSHSIGL
ncbi:MAG: hypothetical protein DMF63_04225 [Acidobacteria bacterium]|nr:MAG: hypothetical protein DMF63_04225 [Acidobacteriota bacterium]